MTIKHILSTTVLALGLTCLSGTARADYISERLHLERELDRICTVSIGAVYNSAAYLECRNFYDRKFYDYGLDWDYLTAVEVNAFLNRTNPYIMQCRNRGLLSTLLWGCIRDFEDRYYHDWHRHHPHFKPKHDYRPHFGAKPAPHGSPAPHQPHAAPAPHGGPAPHGKPAPQPNMKAAPKPDFKGPDKGHGQPAPQKVDRPNPRHDTPNRPAPTKMDKGRHDVPAKSNTPSDDKRPDRKH